MKSVAKPGNGSVATSTARQPLVGSRPDPVGRGRHLEAHLAELHRDELEVLEPRALDRDLAAGDATRHEQRAGLDAVAHDLAVDRRRATRRPRSRSSTSRRRARLAPMRLSMAASSVISGSRAAFSMTVLTLGEHRRGEQVLGRADAREVEHDPRARRAASTRASMNPCTTSSSAPIASRPAEVHVELAAADVVAARHRDPRLAAAREQRAEHVDRRAHPRDELVGRLRRAAAPTRRSCSSRSPVHVDVGTDRAQHVDHHVEVGDAIDVAQRGDTGREERGRHLLEARGSWSRPRRGRARRAGAPRGTTNASVIAGPRSLDEAQRQLVVVTLRDRDAPDLDAARRCPGIARAPRGTAPNSSPTSATTSAVARISPGSGRVAQARREVDRHADEVVAFEQDHLARRRSRCAAAARCRRSRGAR